MAKSSKATASDDAGRGTMEQFLRQLAGSGKTATALGEAARCGYIDLMQEFLQTGVDVNARDEGGCTPLMLAASGGQLEAVRLLITAGANVNVQDSRTGMTPLIWGVGTMGPARVSLSIVRLLLDTGADPNIQANDGMTALDWATLNRREKLVETLKLAGAKSGKPGAAKSVLDSCIDLDAFAMEIRRTDSGYVAVTGICEVELPEPDQLKQAAIDRLLEGLRPADQRAANLLLGCDLSYDVAKGKDVTEPLIEIVIAAPLEAYEILQDEENPLTQNVLAALLEACPEIGSDRIVRKS